MAGLGGRERQRRNGVSPGPARGTHSSNPCIPPAAMKHGHYVQQVVVCRTPLAARRLLFPQPQGIVDPNQVFLWMGMAGLCFHAYQQVRVVESSVLCDDK